MHGRRIPAPPVDGWAAGEGPTTGDYWKDARGIWCGVAPGDLWVNLAGHRVEEHPDGTITVNPSILVSNGTGNKSWHGYIRAGVWEEC